VDPQALIATRANARANDVAAGLTACEPGDLDTALAGRKADILVANILAGPLRDLLPAFAQSLAAGGRIALSGILAGQEAAVADTAAAWFRLDQPVSRGEWLRLSGHRTTAD
jgi:ribosomal protein L11 methyltransferase